MRKNIWMDTVEVHPQNIQLLAKLREGRAFTLTELSNSARTDRKSTQKHLDKMVKSGVLLTRINRKRTYYFLPTGLSIDCIARLGLPKDSKKQSLPIGIKYCRHCYKHLAGYIGVKLTEALVENQILVETDRDYTITEKGWRWFAILGIDKLNFNKSKRLARKCLDFSERKSHLGGQLGDALLERMVLKDWMVQVPDSREILVTETGKKQLKKELGFNFG